MRFAGSKNITDFLGVKPGYAAQGNEAIAGDAREFGARAEANAMVSNAGLKAQADIMSAQHFADAAVAKGEAAGQSSMVGGIAGGLGGLSGFIPKGGLFGGGGGSAVGNTVGGLGGGAGGLFG
jgi:hypothetical protein